MDCHSNHSVFLRANGSLVCWDDAGSRLTLHEFDPAVDASKTVVFGDVFTNIRRSLRAGKMPFPEYCKGCLILASGVGFNPRWQRNKEILIFQVESSIACTLECPGCMTFAERKRRHGKPWHLDIAIFEKYLADFKADGVIIRTIDFQGHGEPLLNKDVWKMAEVAKSYFPEANISMCTASHGTYHPSQVHSGIDEMMFAIDGVDQKSFEPNRVRGNFDRAYGFMKAFCQGAIAEKRPIKTVWKYILFDCNSQPDQLRRAQEMAAEAGVQELLFVNTQLGLKLSKQLTMEDIPLLDNGVKVRLSDYLSNFNDTVHSIDKARFALIKQQPKTARAHLTFAANMIRRRFECIEPHDTLPEKYQAVVYEVLDLSEHRLIDDDSRRIIQGGLKRLQRKLDMGEIPAKNLIIDWKTKEIKRLAGQLGLEQVSGPVARAKRRFAQQKTRFEDRFALSSLSAKNQTLREKAEEVHRLACKLTNHQEPDPGGK